VWIGVLAGIGYALGSSYHSMVKAFGDASYVAAALVVIALAFTIVHRFRAMRAEQARLGAAHDVSKLPADQS
jgi:membrane protein DedA with SNARE-associated domain